MPCTNKITTKPANSSYTYASCTDGDGTKQIQTAWTCNSGYHEKNGACEQDCIVNSCSGFTLSSCPTNANCSSCTITAQNCDTDGTKYKITSCKNGSVTSCSGYTLSSCPTNGNCSSCKVINSDCSTGSTKYKLTSCQSGYKVSGNTCIKSRTIGDIVYSDYTYSSEVISGKTPIGIYIGEGIIGLYNYTYDWNTAFSYCESYSISGIYGWHLPEESQLQKMFNNISIINTRLSQLGYSQIVLTTYWSASEDSSNIAGAIDYNGNYSATQKGNARKVRCANSSF